jgi:8-oxo-dGTP diphosphatase
MTKSWLNKTVHSWVSLKHKPRLIFDHNQMVEKALEKLRYKASYEIIGEHLLPEKFTLLQLRNLYSAIFNVNLIRATSAKKYCR